MLLVFLAARGAVSGAGLLAAARVFFLAAPMGFLFSRTEPDGRPADVLLHRTLLAGRAAVLRREERRPWIGDGLALRRVRRGGAS